MLNNDVCIAPVLTKIISNIFILENVFQRQSISGRLTLFYRKFSYFSSENFLIFKTLAVQKISWRLKSIKFPDTDKNSSNVREKWLCQFESVLKFSYVFWKPQHWFLIKRFLMKKELVSILDPLNHAFLHQSFLNSVRPLKTLNRSVA